MRSYYKFLLFIFLVFSYSSLAMDSVHVPMAWDKERAEWMAKKIVEMGAIDSELQQENLKNLAWLIGRWEGVGDFDVGEGVYKRLTIISNYHWDEIMNFIIFDHSFYTPEGVTLIEGTEIIYWNEAAHAIQSWCKNPQTESPKEYWKYNDGRWVIKAISVENGVESIYKPQDARAFTWENHVFGKIKVEPFINKKIE